MQLTVNKELFMETRDDGAVCQVIVTFFLRCELRDNLKLKTNCNEGGRWRIDWQQWTLIFWKGVWWLCTWLITYPCFLLAFAARFPETFSQQSQVSDSIHQCWAFYSVFFSCFIASDCMLSAGISHLLQIILTSFFSSLSLYILIISTRVPFLVIFYLRKVFSYSVEFSMIYRLSRSFPSVTWPWMT